MVISINVWFKMVVKIFKNNSNVIFKLNLFLFMICYSVLLCGCSDKIQTSVCVPPNIQTKITPTSNVFKKAAINQSKTNLTKITPSAIDFYLDVSLSMKGFVVQPRSAKPDKNEINYNYIKILSMLPTICPAITENSDSVHYSKFGIRIVPMDIRQLYKAATPVRCFSKVNCSSFYDTDNKGKPCNNKDCIYKESHIGEVLKQTLKKSKDTLSVILTDLFLMKEEISGETSQVCQPLIQSLKTGKAVGILGVKSRFIGNVYDLPLDYQRYYTLNGSRPIFMIMIGQEEHVLSFYHKLKNQIFEKTPKDHYNFIIFTSRILKNPITMENVYNVNGLNIFNGKQSKRLIKDFPIYQQYILKQVKRTKKTAKLSLDLSKVKRPHSLVVNKYKYNKKLWIHHFTKSKDIRICERSWIDLKLKNFPVNINDKEEAMDILFFKSKRGFPRGKTYFLSLQINIDKVGFDSHTLKWLSQWSFKASDQIDLLQKKPDFFPALNLKQLYMILRDVITEEVINKQIGFLNISFRETRSL